MTEADPFIMRWLLTPAFYASSAVPVLGVGIFAVDRVEQSFGCGWACEFGGLQTILVFGAPVFALLSVALARFENLQVPGFLDHLRHCAMLYVGLSALACVLVVSYGVQGHGLAWVLGTSLFLVAVYAVLIDATVVYVIRQRYSARVR